MLKWKPLHFYSAIAVAVMVWIGNYTYYEAAQIAEPVFLDHFYETYHGDDEYVTFYYLTNKDDTSSIQYVELDGVALSGTEEDEMLEEDPEFIAQDIVIREYQHQNLKSIMVNVPEAPKEKVKNGIWEFDHIIVHFNDGRSQKAHIGKVKIVTAPKAGSFDFGIGGGSNQNREGHEMMAMENILIHDISSSFPELEKLMQVKVHIKSQQGKPTGKSSFNEFNNMLNGDWSNIPGSLTTELDYPVSIKKYDWISLFVEPKNRLKAYVQCAVIINGTGENGKPVSSQVRVQMQPELSQSDIRSIIAQNEKK